MKCVESQYFDVLPSIAAENAATRAKIKQEFDCTCVIGNNIKRADQYIEILKRDNEKYNELYEIKLKQMERLEEELTSLTLSREHVQNNSENLKKQYELMLIEDEQRKKERDMVRASYETMIKNKEEIFSSNRLVVKRNNLRNQCEAARINFAVLTERDKELDKQRKMLREIQNLKLKSVSVDLADSWLRNKRGKEKIITWKQKLIETQEMKKNQDDNHVKESTPRNPGSQFLGLPIPTSSPIRVPPLQNLDDNDLTKYFLKINLFKKTRTSPMQLPAILSKSLMLRERESLNSPKICSSTPNPAKRICTNIPKSNDVAIKELSPKSSNLSENPSTFQPISSEETEEQEIIYDQPKSHSSSKSISPVVKPKVVEKHASPLTISRMSPNPKSPMKSSRIPVAINSPLRTPSRIPVKCTPAKTIQKRDFEKNRRQEIKSQENTDFDRKNEMRCKRMDANSPKPNIKYAKMDVQTENFIKKMDAFNAYGTASLLDTPNENAMLKDYMDRMKQRAFLESGLKKTEVEDIEKLKKSVELESEFYDVSVLKNKYDETVKNLEKYHEETQKFEVDKHFKDVEKSHSQSNEQEFPKDKKEDTPNKKLPENEIFQQYDNYQPNMESLSDVEEEFSKSSLMSSDYRNMSEVVSPLGDGFSLSPPEIGGYGAQFGSIAGSSMFGFDGGVNQLFGSADGSNGQNSQNNGFFGFDFSAKKDAQPFSLF